MNGRNDFPERIDEHGEVSEHEPHYVDVDTLGEGVSDTGEHCPCDGDPQNVQNILHEIAHALRRDDDGSEWLVIPTYRSWLEEVYRRAKRCSDHLPEDDLIRFEIVLEKHGIITD